MGTSIEWNSTKAHTKDDKKKSIVSIMVLDLVLHRLK